MKVSSCSTVNIWVKLPLKDTTSFVPALYNLMEGYESISIGTSFASTLIVARAALSESPSFAYLEPSSFITTCKLFNMLALAKRRDSVGLLGTVLTPWYVELNQDIFRLVVNQVVKITTHQLCQKRLGSRYFRHWL